jgi:hypothetical protein
MATRLVRSACDPESKAMLVGHRMGDQKFIISSLCALEGTLSRWSRLHLQTLASINPHWARVVGFGPFSLCVIHKEDLCPSSGDINRLICW